ncbi:MAG: TldD/PmbA family protein [Acidobacteria bacterium]|nr:TldD/PmbA family protein [Acidobacteriota bacterium]MBI3279030.1 TldD/PmbA family protein [Acidobacteriota bacterium]
MSARGLQDLAAQVVELALAAGANDAECTVSEGDEFSVNVRMGEVETLTEAGARGAGVRVLVGRHTGSSYTSDLTGDGLRTMVRSALDLARITTEDPHAGLPDPDELGKLDLDLQLYSDSVAQLEPEFKIEQARRAEKAALDFDPRIANSEGASFNTDIGQHAFANSRGFVGSYRTSSCSMAAVPVAKNGGAMERDFWFTLARRADRLESPEAVGRRAAERALRRLGPRKIATQRVPVVFEPRIAQSLLANIFEAVSGDSIYRHESFLAGKLGEKIASEALTVVDDGTIPGLFGSSPFDDEGVPVRRTVVIERGVLKSYLLNTYTARKLGMNTTGNASRGLTGNAGIGHNNLFLEPGRGAPEQIIASVKSGFYVTELMGFGVNIVTGDYSRGAVGLWIENGELAYPVSEVTIASTLPAMLAGLEKVGSDLEFRGSVAAPTILIAEMTVSGQ